MAVGFRRSISFVTAKQHFHRRARSTSLPARSHPLLSRLHAAAVHLRSSVPSDYTTTPVSDDFSCLSALLAELSDLLHQPLAQQALYCRRCSPWAQRLLDDLLRLADAYDAFRSTLITLRQLHADAHSALRRRDAARLAAVLRAQRRVDRDLTRLAASVRALDRPSCGFPNEDSSGDANQAALTAAISEATAAAAAGSAEIFAGVAALSSAPSSSAWSSWASCPLSPARLHNTSPARSSPLSAVIHGKSSWVADLLRWRRRTRRSPLGISSPPQDLEPSCNYDDDEASEDLGVSEEEKQRMAAMESVRSVEECVMAAEAGSDGVFRALANARVSLLNIFTPSF